jgi:hypothetical protein
MSASDSDEYQTEYEMYEMILKEADTAIKEDISDYKAGTKDMKEYVSSHINVLFREHIDDLQDQGISRSKIDDLKVRMNAELCPKATAKKKKRSRKKTKKRSRKKRSYRKTKRRSRSRQNR